MKEARNKEDPKTLLTARLHQHNVSEHQHNLSEHQHNLSEHQHNVSEHQHNLSEHQPITYILKHNRQNFTTGLNYE